MQTGVIVGVAAACVVLGTSIGHAAESPDEFRSAVDAAVKPVMAKNELPGLAVGITIGGRHLVFDYGAAALDPRKPVTDGTLFEIGSISKTFTATLAAWAQVGGQLSFSDETGKYFPSLQRTPFGKVTLLNLATHTPGGMPLQVPGTVTNDDQLMAFFKAWQPTYPAGTYRTYANPSIGLLGRIAAQSLHQDFTALMETRLFPGLGLSDTYIDVPASKMADYAQGYTSKGEPIRMKPAVLSAEAYGVKTTAADLLRVLDANMGLGKLGDDLQRAVTETHTGYFKADVITQDLIWEQYAYPVELKTLVAGNSPRMLDPTPAMPITPPLPPQTDVLINKTGSTNGFGAYVAFVPARQEGVVILANKSYPNEDRVTLAYRILALLRAGDPRD